MLLQLPQCHWRGISFKWLPPSRQTVGPVSDPFLCAGSSLRGAWNTMRRWPGLGPNQTENYPLLAVRKPASTVAGNHIVETPSCHLGTCPEDWHILPRWIAMLFFWPKKEPSGYVKCRPVGERCPEKGNITCILVETKGKLNKGRTRNKASKNSFIFRDKPGNAVTIKLNYWLIWYHP